METDNPNPTNEFGEAWYELHKTRNANYTKMVERYLDPSTPPAVKSALKGALKSMHGTKRLDGSLFLNDFALAEAEGIQAERDNRPQWRFFAGCLYTGD
jgi:hypothetical protein